MKRPNSTTTAAVYPSKKEKNHVCARVSTESIGDQRSVLATITEQYNKPFSIVISHMACLCVLSIKGFGRWTGNHCFIHMAAVKSFETAAIIKSCNKLNLTCSDTTSSWSTA